MPITEEQWEQLRDLHEDHCETGRSATALSNKFKELYRKKEPTGNPKMPDYIGQAKDIHQEYRRRTDGSDGGDEDDEDDDDDDDDRNNDDDDVDDELANYFHPAEMEPFDPAQANNIPPVPPLPEFVDDLTTTLRPLSRTSSIARPSSSASGTVRPSAATSATPSKRSSASTRPPGSTSKFNQQMRGMGTGQKKVRPKKVEIMA
jgi:hypothetical protein